VTIEKMPIRWLIMMALALSGCGTRSGEEISGTVTLDGEPLSHGYVRLLPLGVARGETIIAEVQDGRFHVGREQGPLPGQHRVEISAPGAITQRIPALPPAPAGTMIEVTREGLPPDFNTNSTLTCDIKPGVNELSFHLATDTTTRKQARPVPKVIQPGHNW
jgi:hypothetical protein